MGITVLITLLTLFLVPLISGLAILQFQPNPGKSIKLLLAFSASFLLAICFTHLLPEIFNESNSWTGLFVLLGFFIQVFLEYFSAGIEHGHIHPTAKSSFPTMIFIGLFFHSFIEGFPLADLSLLESDGEKLYALLTGIIVHKVPIAIVLTVLLIGRKVGKLKLILALILFCLSAPLGTISVLFTSFISESVNTNYLTALTIGIFLHISTVILFESSDNHQFNKNKLLAIILGIVVALISFGMH